MGKPNKKKPTGASGGARRSIDSETESMMAGVQYADEQQAADAAAIAHLMADPSTDSVESLDELESAPPPPSEGRSAGRVSAGVDAFQRMVDSQSARMDLNQRPRRFIPEAPPALSAEQAQRLRPRIYRVLRHPDRQGPYQIPGAVMRIPARGVSLVELHPGQPISDRDYDIDRLRNDHGVLMEEVISAKSA